MKNKAHLITYPPMQTAMCEYINICTGNQLGPYSMMYIQEFIL